MNIQNMMKLAEQHISPFDFKGQNSIPHNPKNNRKTKSKGKKK